MCKVDQAKDNFSKQISTPLQKGKTERPPHSHHSTDTLVLQCWNTNASTSGLPSLEQRLSHHYYPLWSSASSSGGLLSGPLFSLATYKEGAGETALPRVNATSCQRLFYGLTNELRLFTQACGFFDNSFLKTLVNSNLLAPRLFHLPVFLLSVLL